MRKFSLIHRAVLAGALALSLTGATAGFESARALPIGPALAHTAGVSDITTAQYMRYPHSRYRRYNYHRRAGLYRCGLSGLNTHLARKACR